MSSIVYSAWWRGGLDKGWVILYNIHSLVSLYSVANVRPNKGYATASGLYVVVYTEKIFINFKN
jgi:hypothetical protein